MVGIGWDSIITRDMPRVAKTNSLHQGVVGGKI